MVALAAMVAALAALGAAFYAQHVLLLTPCELCLWERWPYRIAAVLALLAIFLPARRLLLGLVALTMLGGAGIAFLHVGVEQGWWNSPLPECNGYLPPGAPLPMLPSTPCDRPVYLIPHVPVSMAAMDLLAALSFAILVSAYLIFGERRRGWSRM
jgi:disulfide bond formation protein DsbB